MRVLNLCFATLLACSLTGCATETITPQNVDRLMSNFATGNINLSSSIATVGNTGFFASQMMDFYIKQDWANLAKLVIKSNNATDFSWFMLASSAEGLGFRSAAVAYYNDSISANFKLCEPGGNYLSFCGGIQLPNDAITRLSALQQN
jgi:hypothetical protein